MSMLNRQRAELLEIPEEHPPAATTEPRQNESSEMNELMRSMEKQQLAVQENFKLITQKLEDTEMIELMRSVQRQQLVTQENFNLIVRRLEDSEQEKQALVKRLDQAVIGLTKQEEELVRVIQKQQIAKEQQLMQALQEVNNLKQELTRGFLEMASRTKVPLSHQLAKIATAGSISLIGAIVVYLLLMLAAR